VSATSYPYGSDYFAAGDLEFNQAKYSNNYFAYAADLDSTVEPTEPPPTEPAEEEVCVAPSTEAPVPTEPVVEEVCPTTEPPATEDPSATEDPDGDSSEEPSFSVSVSTTFSELTVADWTDEVEADFLAVFAAAANVDLTRIEVISITSADIGIYVQVEITDFTEEAEADDVATLDYEFPENFGAAETEVDVLVAEDAEVEPTYTVSVSATLADVSLLDWTPDVESVFLSALATAVDVAVNRFEVIAVISSDAGGVDIEVEVSDFADIEEADSLATLDYEFPEELGVVETEVGTPVEVEAEVENEDEVVTSTDTSMYTPLTYSSTLLGQTPDATDGTDTDDSSLAGLTTEIMFDVGHRLNYVSVSFFVIWLHTWLLN